MAGPDPYLADPAELAEWLPVPATDTKLLAALRDATRRFRGAVRHPVSLVTDDAETTDGTGTDRLLLRAAPILTVHEVRVDGDPVTDYKVKKQAGVLLRTGGKCWPEWSEITTVYDHGLDPVPDQVSEAVIDLAKTLYRVKPGIQSVQAGGEAVTYGTQATVGVTEQWRAAVEAHQLNRGDRP